MPAHLVPSTPARLTTTATSKLPRTVLLVVGIIYILAGLFFRDPWKTDDVVGLATMLTTLQEAGTTSWLLPHVGSLAHAQDGPLTTWAGALSILAFAPLLEFFVPARDAAILASRLPNLIWFGLLCWAIWYGTYLLGRRPESQPLALPFGGEPSPRDYGRMIADAGLLLTVATIGIVWRMHETSAVPAIVAFQALAFYAMARMLDKPLSGALALGVATGAAFLTRGWPGSLPIILAAALCCRPASLLWGRRTWLLPAGLIALAIGLLWWIPASQANSYWTDQWWRWQTDLTGWPTAKTLFSLLRDLPWFLWPTWPFALIALWRWRAWMGSPHIWIPLAFALTPLGLMVFMQAVFEPEYALLVVPSAVLAAFSLPTLRRGVVNSLDWFAVMCFSLACATVWLGWIALQTGWPPKIAHNIARLSTGYKTYLNPLAVTVATLGTASWIMLVRWRLLSRPAALWRGTVLSAGGLIVTWLLLVTLWLPVLDYARSYRQVSADLATILAHEAHEDDCIRTLGVGLGQRASFLVFDDIDLSYDTRCRLILQQTSPAAIQSGDVYTPAGTHPIWTGKRGADRHEAFRLLRKEH